MNIKSKIISLQQIKWRELQWLQADLKHIPKDKLNKLKQSLRANHFIQPFNVWIEKKGATWILDGHHRKLAMEQLEKEGVTIPELLPANVIDCKNRKEAAQLVLIYSSIYADVTDEGLLKYLQTENLDTQILLETTDLPGVSLLKLLNQNAVNEDEAPPLPKKPRSKLGDLYELGQHRILCGDSTNEKDVARLMKGKKAGLINTDPPYGVNYENNKRPNPGVAKPRVAKPRVANDLLKDEALQLFLEKTFRIAKDLALNINAAWYLWHAHLTQGFFAAAAAAADVILHRQIIWVKPVLLLGRGHYHWKHEPCFMGWIKGHQPPDYAERNQTTVWEIASVKSDERKTLDHSTPKPVQLFTIPISKHLKINEICYEPFSGSGPQIIAAHQLNRICYAMEIEPKYVDVAVTRWCKFTGETNIKLNGKPIKWKTEND